MAKPRPTEEELLAKIRTLPTERVAEVEDFVDFLKVREARTRKANVDELFEMMDQLSAVEPKLTPEEIQAEIKAARAERRTKNANRR